MLYCLAVGDGPVDGREHVAHLPDAVAVQHPEVDERCARREAGRVGRARNGLAAGDRRDVRAVAVHVRVRTFEPSIDFWKSLYTVLPGA